MAKSGSCVAGDSCPLVGDASHRYECLRPSDCGAGFQCFNSTGMHMQSDFHCGHTECGAMVLFIGPVLCDTLADCPPLLWAGADGQVGAHSPYACQPDPDSPPGVKACAYR